MTATRSFGLVLGVSVVLGLGWGRAAAQDQARRASPDSQGTDAAVGAPAAQRPTPLPRFQPFIPTTGGPNTVAVELDAAAWDQVRAHHGVSILERFPLRPALTVDLEVKRFHVTRPDTRFVVHCQGADVAIDFDPSRVTLLRGKASGYARSHVVLAVSPHGSTGYLDLGEGEALYQVRSGEAAPGGAAVEQLEVFEETIGGGPVPDVPFCGFDELHDGTPPPEPSGDRGPVWGMLQLELAVDTDYEFFELFGNLDAAAAYVVTLYGVVSDIYMREVSTRIELSFVRLWDTPDDLFNEENPIYSFSSHWSQHMQHVHRDLSQLLTGRRDLPYGGAAWLRELCTGGGDSVAGYILGYFAGPDRPSTANWDIFVTAHELGHNCGVRHTHNLGIDDCDDGEYRRGTIMSYCHLGAGGGANIDSRFHSQMQIGMEYYLGGADCLAPDCNLNGIDDALDVAAGTSLDANTNGIPDECEDCNTNGVLDDADIAGATSQDVNSNGIPDECEPDCNSNGVPDQRDIAQGTSDDLYGDNVPDECAADCNSNGQPDYDELQAEMSLDVNRDVVLDACQDCDGDGLADLDALAGAHHLWVQSRGSNVAVQCHPNTGAPVRSTSAGPVVGFDLIVGPGGHLLLASIYSVAQFDELTGAFLDWFVRSGDGGLDRPKGLTLTAEGHVLVTSQDTDSVLEYDSDGTFVGEFVTAGLGGLSSPYGLTFGPTGNLFVCSDGNDQVIEYDGQTGAFVRVFVSSGSGGLEGPRGLTFMPDGHLLVAGVHSDALHKYHGQTGESLGIFNGPAGNPPILFEPWGVRIGPNGNVFVTRPRYGGEPRVIEYDARSGRYVRMFVRGTEAQLLGLRRPTGLVFLPGWDVDCNFNLIPDECDLAAGTSLDTDGNGIPDECEVDCNTNGVPDRLELCPHGSSFDCNANFVPDECDVRGGTSQDCDSNLVPDECEPDCNLNGIPDACDIAAGTSVDCQPNGIPDECEPGWDLDCNTNSIPDLCDIAGGTSQDCQSNGVPDECDVSLFTTASSELSPIGRGSPQSYTITTPPVAIGAVTLSFAAYADLESFIEYITVDINGVVVGNVFQSGAQDCPGYPDVDELLVSMETYEAARAGGDAIIGLVASHLVDPNSCSPQSFITVRISYRADADCNTNGMPDECDIAGVTSQDCQPNGIPDECELADNDCNSNGIPDECEPDCNGNQTPDDCDIAGGTSDDCNSNGVPDECEPDCNTNGIPDACDLAAGTSVDCQGDGIPDECEEEPVTCGDLDLKPGSCPNSFNRGSHGVLPVALMGSESFDLSQVDISSIRLWRVAEAEPDPCEHCITMWDTWGDGWNGGFIDVYVDGDLVLAGVTLAWGFGPGTVCLEADAGSVIQTIWSPGGWPWEPYYCIYDGFGDELGCDGLDWTVPTGITVTGNCPAGTMLIGEVPPHEGPPGPHTVFADTATPFDEAVECECADLNGDGIDDLSMEFKTDDVVPGLELDGLPAGALVSLVITGQMIGGGASFTTPTDCLRLVPPGTPGALLAVESSVPGAWVDVSPPDLTLDTGGFADFERTFPLTTVVTLTAEEWADGRPLRGWQIGGLLHHMGETSLEFVIDQDMTVQAVYGPTPSGSTKPPGEMAPDEMAPEPIQGQSAESGTIDRR